MEATYVISRGFQEGVPLTTAQKTSALFREEPTVLGHTLRRLSPNLKVDEKTFKQNEHHLLRLEKAGAIRIRRPPRSAAEQEDQKFIDEVEKLSGNEPIEVSGAGDTTPTLQEGAEAVVDASGPPADPPDVIVPPHPPTPEDPPAPEPQPTPPVVDEPAPGVTVMQTAGETPVETIPEVQEEVAAPAQGKKKSNRKERP